MIVVRDAVVHPRTVTIDVSSNQPHTPCVLTDRFLQHTAHTSCSAYFAEACAPYN